MKVSRAVWIILIASLAVAAFAIVGTLSWQKFEQRDRLREQLTLAEDKLKEAQSQQASNRGQSLELQLGKTMETTRTPESLFSRPSWDIVTSSLFDFAKSSNVEVIRISSGGSGSEKLGEITSTTRKFNITVEGSLNDLVKYVTTLNHELKTGVVKSVDLSAPAEGEEKPSANLLLVVYTYEGS